MTEVMPLDALALLEEIAHIGRDPVRGGYSRHVFEPAELQLRAWFSARATALGLQVCADRNGNLWAWWGAPGPGAILTGSHLDSVPGGGALDGPLGVVSALAAVARLRHRGFVPSRPFAIVVFAEEEGSRFGVACLGSRLSAGLADPVSVRQLRDRSGVMFSDAARAATVDPDRIGADPHLQDAAAFVELHLEQGVGLAELDRPIAVAAGVLAHGRWRFAFHGEGNHAGTTRMASRRDPVLAAARFALAARDTAVAHGRDARATVGRFEVVPGGTNVIASCATAWLDARSGVDADLDALVARVSAAADEAAVAEGCTAEVQQESLSRAVYFDTTLRDRLVELLDAAPVLATGAGHDAAVLSARIPTAMLFVRNHSGVSHAPGEHAAPTDIAAGVDALEHVLFGLL